MKRLTQAGNGRLVWIPVVTVSLLLAFSSAFAAQRPVVYAVNYPLMYFAQRIAGEHAEVRLPVPPDVDPAFWRPSVEVIEAFQKADLILINGAGYAKWLDRVSLPRRKVVDTSAGFSDRYIATAGTVTHSHGREGSHSHAGTAFTTWLDFAQAAEQARAIRDALSRLVPDQKAAFDKKFVALERELLALDAQLKIIVARDPQKPLFASHPVYQYLTRRYSLNVKAVMWEPEDMVPESEWKNLGELGKAHAAKWMLWESEPSTNNQKRLEQLGIRSAVFDPCGNRPIEGDFLSVMKKNVHNMELVFGR